MSSTLLSGFGVLLSIMFAKIAHLCTLDGLRREIPAAFASISPASINRFYAHCSRTIDAYINGYKYGTKAFIDHVYKSRRRIEDKSKW